MGQLIFRIAPLQYLIFEDVLWNFFPSRSLIRWFESIEAGLWQWCTATMTSLSQECKCWFAWLLLLNFSFLKTWIEPTLSRKKSQYNCRHLRTDWDQQTFSRKKENSNHLKRSLFDAFFASTVLIPLPKIPNPPVAFLSWFRNCEFCWCFKGFCYLRQNFYKHNSDFLSIQK